MMERFVSFPCCGFYANKTQKIKATPQETACLFNKSSYGAIACTFQRMALFDVGSDDESFEVLAPLLMHFLLIILSLNKH